MYPRSSRLARIMALHPKILVYRLLSWVLVSPGYTYTYVYMYISIYIYIIQAADESSCLGKEHYFLSPAPDLAYSQKILINPVVSLFSEFRVVSLKYHCATMLSFFTHEIPGSRFISGPFSLPLERLLPIPTSVALFLLTEL